MKNSLRAHGQRAGKILRAAGALLGLAAGMAWAAGETTLPRREITFGDPLVSSYWGQKILQLAPAEPLPQGSYRVRAEIVPRISGAGKPDDGIPLVPAGAARPDQSGVTQEFLAPSGTRLQDFTELLAETEDRRGCRADWSMEFQSAGPGQSRRIVRLGDDDLQAADATVIMAEQPDHLEWVRKGLGYLFRRELGLAPDQRWRYAQDGGFTVIQRRLDIPLRDAHTIELEFPGGTVLSGVNLSISKGPGRKAHQLLSGGEFTSRTEDDGTRTRVSLHLGSALADRARWGDAPHLSEILISYQGNEADVARARPLRSMRVLGEPTRDSVTSPSARIDHLTDAASGKRLQRRYFPTEGIDRTPGNAEQFAGMLLHVPQGCENGIFRASLIRPESARPEPEFLAGVRRQLEKMGGPFLRADSASREWLQYVQWLPFAAADTEMRRLPGPDAAAELPGWGVRLQWSGAHPRLAIAREGLVASGLGTARMDWAFHAIARPDLHVYADMPSGALQFNSLDAELQLESGAISRFQLTPNRAQPLPADIPAGTRIRGLSITFQPSGSPQDWTLASLGIFRPYLVPQGDLASQPRPGWALRPLPLAPDEGMLPGGTYRWTSHPSGLRAGDLLQARITHTFGTLPREACWLTVEATGERGGQARTTFCPSTAQWQTGLSALRQSGSLAPDEPLSTLVWSARLSAPPQAGGLQVLLGTAARPSVLDTLSHGLALQLERGAPPLRPVGGSPASVPALPAPVWLDYGAWKPMADRPPADHPWQDEDLFELRRITWVADPSLWPALEEQRKTRLRQSVAAFPQPEAGLRLQSAWLALFIMAVVLATARSQGLGRLAMQWCRPFRIWADGMRDWIRTSDMPQAFPHAKAMFTAAATGLALLWMWMGGRKDAEAPWFLAAGLLATLTVCVRLWPAAPDSRLPGPSLRPVVALLWFALLAWLLGHLGPPKQFLAHASLVLACVLWTGFSVSTAPAASLRTIACHPGFLLMLSSLGLYALGLSAPAIVRRENVWITMGAIVLVAAWWQAARGLLPALEARGSRWACALRRVPGGGLLAGAVAALALSCAALWLGQSVLAAHLSTLFFYFWCAGAAATAIGAWAVRDRPGSSTASATAPRGLESRDP
ncbi:hypothetical protein [Acidovorax sacchari]|uniref:hypothetical protein n=1 Tax=Acidovorax sacchari TaxID=3230736 RepID=UPI0039E3DDA0